MLLPIYTQYITLSIETDDDIMVQLPLRTQLGGVVILSAIVCTNLLELGTKS